MCLVLSRQEYDSSHINNLPAWPSRL